MRQSAMMTTATLPFGITFAMWKLASVTRQNTHSKPLKKHLRQFVTTESEMQKLVALYFAIVRPSKLVGATSTETKAK